MATATGKTGGPGAMEAGSKEAGSTATARPMPPGEHYNPLPEKDDHGRVTGHAVQTILAEPQALYELWRDVAMIPRWQEYVISVTPRDTKRTHWVMGDPEQEDAKRVEFDSEMTEDQPGRKLAWRSVTADVDLNGSVTFEPAGSGRGTLVTLIQSMKLPGGAAGNAFLGIGKRTPRQIIIEDLRHFKQLAETGEIPSVEGQPHGPRGMKGNVKEWFYGENNPTPPGTSERPEAAPSSTTHNIPDGGSR